MSGHPMSIKYLGDTHVPYVSLSPLVEPDIGFSPVPKLNRAFHLTTSRKVEPVKTIPFGAYSFQGD